VPVTFAFSIFLGIFFPSICRDAHQGIVFLQLHKILTPLLTTPPWEFTTSSTTFRTYFSTPSVHSFEIFSGYKSTTLPESSVAKFEEIESVMSSIECLHGVMCILWNRSFSASEKFHIDFANYFQKTMLNYLAKKYWHFRAFCVFNVIGMLFRWKSSSWFSQNLHMSYFTHIFEWNIFLHSFLLFFILRFDRYMVNEKARLTVKVRLPKHYLIYLL